MDTEVMHPGVRKDLWRSTRFFATALRLPIPRPPRSVELRGGDVLGVCECLKRNGLQLDCPKWECRGGGCCLTWPLPTCQPSGLGPPKIVESRVCRPDPAMCEMTADEKAIVEKKAAQEKRKEEVRLIEKAREGWKSGVEQANIRKAESQSKGYSSCKIHNGKIYKLVPLTKSKKTQTTVVDCDMKQEGYPTEQHQRVEDVEIATEATKKCSKDMEEEATSTTGLPSAEQLKSIKKLK